MRKSLFLTGIFAICLLLSFSIKAQQPPKADRLSGTYLTSDGESTTNQSHVRIFKGANGKYYGEIVWLKVPKYPDGQEKVDRLNPESSLQKRKLIGLKILNDFTYSEADEEWSGGTIYNPANGKIYNSYITLEGKDKINIRGYIGKSWMGLGKTVQWTRIK